MHYHNINVVAVLVAAVVSFLLGWLWYSPVLFANTWMKALGKTKEDIMKGGKQAMFKGMGISFLQALIVAIGIAHFFNLGGGSSIGMAIETALVCWFAFVVMLDLVTRTYEQSNMTLFYVHVGYRLFEFIIIALILYWMH
jgi:hypothetical protein